MRDEAGHATGLIDLASQRACHRKPHQSSALISPPERLAAEEEHARGLMLEALGACEDRLTEELLEDVMPSTADICRNLMRDL